jgi:hypothetical protein
MNAGTLHAGGAVSGCKARTTSRVNRLLVAAGFQSLVWHAIYFDIIKAVTASV